MADLLGDDPAAEFLQQEEDQLRELGIDENQFEDTPAAQDVDNNIMSEFEADMPQTEPSEPVMNGFAEPANMPVINMQPAEEPESLKKWRDEKTATLQRQVSFIS